MTTTRWAAATFVLICLAIYGRPPDYYNLVLFPAALLLGVLTLAAAIGSRPRDPVTVRLLALGAFLTYGLPLLAMGLEAVGYRLELANGISTVQRVLEISAQTAIFWIPLAAVSVLPIWLRKDPAANKPLLIAVLGFRILSCMMAPWTLLAMGSERGCGGLGVSVLAPVLLVAWYSGRLTALSPEERAASFRRYARLFASIGALTFIFVFAQAIGLFKYDPTYATYFRNANWRLLSFSQMGLPFTLLALLYFAMSVRLFRLSSESIPASPLIDRVRR